MAAHAATHDFPYGTEGMDTSIRRHDV